MIINHKSIILDENFSTFEHIVKIVKFRPTFN
jgi:hypothetical protein